MNMANSTISSIAALCTTDSATSKAATLNLDNVTVKALKVFLMDCAPLQLLGDRSRSDRIGLGKKLLSNLSFLDSLFRAAATADANAGPDASEDRKNEELSKLIKMNPRTGLPHPQWTLVHDSILIRAICKHGLIDKRSSADAIGHDTSIHWGSPFEEGATHKSEKPDEEAEKKFNNDYVQLSRVASRASDFVQAHSGNAFEGLKDGKLNEMRQCLIDTYGLAKTEDNDKWVPNKEKLESILRPSKSSAEVEDLPARRPLLKRIRSVVKSINGKQFEEQEETDQAAAVQDSSQAGDEMSKPKNDHGFVVLDQTDRHNILLVLMMKNQLTFKQSAKVGPKKQLANLILNEFDARIEDLRAMGDDSSISTMSKAKVEFKLYVANMNKNARMAKNVLRVQLGVDPVSEKKGPVGTNLFPTTGEQKKKTTSVSTAAKGALTKLKQKKAFTAADAALNRALSSIAASNDKDGCLRLTSTELLMLTVLSSQGLPVFCESWDSLIHNSKLEAGTGDEDAKKKGQDGDDEEFVIYFNAMAGVLNCAAQVWLKIASRKLDRLLEPFALSGNPIPEKEQEEIATLKKDKDFKIGTLDDTVKFTKDPLAFAKSCITLMEAVRKNIGPVDTQYAGDKRIKILTQSENGLGTKVRIAAFFSVKKLLEDAQISSTARCLLFGVFPFSGTELDGQGHSEVGQGAWKCRRGWKCPFCH